MNKIFTCILCPNGCEVQADFEKGESLSISGNKCPKGAAYVEQEIKNPVRNIASSVLVEGGNLPLVSVRLSGPIPKGKIMDVMEAIRSARVTAPIAIGDVIIGDVQGTGRDVIATKNIEKQGIIDQGAGPA